ncbi:MAG TPA: GreA/GreB family elongation factor [Dongiaceae bacterium]|nr:GreA/GreB family elongation factor [Dongiaceae bacterium]
MSRAFVKENDEQGNELPERPQSPYPNHITPAGLEALHQQLQGLEDAHKRMAEPAGNELIDQDAKHALERDIRYVQDRIARAIVIDPATQARDRVGFGARVETEDEDGTRRRFEIVGEDEADAAIGKLSWVSPLARTLTDAKVGDAVVWKRPAGDLELEILSIDYPA